MKFGLDASSPSISNKSVYSKYGKYIEKFKIAADFELFLRFLFINKINFLK